MKNERTLLVCELLTIAINGKSRDFLKCFIEVKRKKMLEIAFAREFFSIDFPFLAVDL